MKGMLRGTYRLKKSSQLNTNKRKTISLEEFEVKALEKLGGSIAFVSKSEMLWDGDRNEKVKQ